MKIDVILNSPNLTINRKLFYSVDKRTLCLNSAKFEFRIPNGVFGLTVHNDSIWFEFRCQLDKELFRIPPYCFNPDEVDMEVIEQHYNAICRKIKEHYAAKIKEYTTMI